MNNKQLLRAFGQIDETYIAEYLHSMAEIQQKADSRRRARRLALVAALAALMLLLVGCTIAYVLHMRDLKIGMRETERDVFDSYHREVIGTETISQQVLTFSGLEGSTAFQAAKEWFAFVENYDPDKSIRAAAFAEGNPEAQFPDTYWAYHIYSQEMEDQLRGLAGKYNLKLLGAPMEFRSMSGFQRALGIDHILLPQSKASLHLDSGTCYPGGNFEMDIALNLPQGEDAWHHTIPLILYYSRKDCLSTQFQYLDTAKNWKEWNYTTASGQNVLILRAAEGSGAYLFCDQGDSTMTISFAAGFNPMTDDPDFQPEWMTDHQVEQVADAIDFTIRPQLPDTNAAAVTGHTPGWEIVTKEVHFDGAFGKLVFGLTAPFGTDLQIEKGGDVYPDNLNRLVFLSDHREAAANYWTYYSRDDGDRKKNTAEIVIEFGVEDIDDPIFQTDTQWYIHMEDLIARRSNGMQEYETIIAQGVWEPEFTFAACNFRKKECLAEPLTIMQNGRKETLVSLELRSMCAMVTMQEGTTDRFLPEVEILLKDGTVIPKGLGDTMGLTGRIAFSTPIDPEQAAFIRFADRTKLPVP